MKSRRSFLTHSAAVTSGFLGLQHFLSRSAGASEAGAAEANSPFGKLIPDPEGLLDLPADFQYEVISRTGDLMGDGYKVPGHPDGMAAFALDGGRIALIRNHEIGHNGFPKGPFEDNTKIPEGLNRELVYDAGRFGAQPFVGGTTTVIFDVQRQKVVDQYLSLVGTDRNCAGGPTPWGSWITCEEPADMTTQWGLFHGYCFEVPASPVPGLVKPVPIRAMGRFRHEAIAVDPTTGVIYLTEDRSDGVLYRFLPNEPGKLLAGGRLQALGLRDDAPGDSRNWPDSKKTFPIGERLPVRWIDLEDIESPHDNLRHQALEKGALIFSRGEGMWFGSEKEVEENAVYFACTDGGANQAGQIFRYYPSAAEGSAQEDKVPGEIELYLEPNDTELLKNGDNITIAPSGTLYICEDSKGTNMVRGVTVEGQMFTLASNRLNGSELAGVCFSPGGETLFVNIQQPGITFAITGPFLEKTEA